MNAGGGSGTHRGLEGPVIAALGDESLFFGIYPRLRVYETETKDEN
jgi:hypothetical protein